MIDTHVHLIEPDRFDYPWLDAVPDLAGSWTIDKWSAGAADAGIEQGIFMEVDVAESDMISEASYFCRIAGDPDTPIVGVIAASRPETKGFEAHLDSIDSPYLVGLRRVLHVAPKGTLDSRHLVGNLKLVADHDLPFDLCLRPDQLRAVLEIVDACPETQFVLDHAGNPPVLTDRFSDWKSDLTNLALRPNVACKISGLVNHVPETSDPLSTLQPVIDHAASRFGVHRLLFGGDWPVSTLRGFSLSDWATLAQQLTAGWSSDEQTALFEANARRIYGVG